MAVQLIEVIPAIQSLLYGRHNTGATRILSSEFREALAEHSAEHLASQIIGICIERGWLKRPRKGMTVETDGNIARWVNKVMTPDRRGGYVITSKILDAGSGVSGTETEHPNRTPKKTKRKLKWDDEAEQCANAYMAMLDDDDWQEFREFCLAYADKNKTKCRGSTLEKKLSQYRKIWDSDGKYFRKQPKPN
jgi:hypothetical protein